MEITIILAGIFIASMYTGSITSNDNIEYLAFFGCVISGFFILLHLIVWPLQYYSYDDFELNRQELVCELQDLEKSKNGTILLEVNNFEDSIPNLNLINKIFEWNNRLTDLKETNNDRFAGCYVDDRIDNLQIIKLK